MENFSFESAKVVGTATPKFWSQVHLFSPQEAEKKQLRGQLLAVLSLSGLAEGVESVAAGREIISRLHEEYYGSLEGSAFKKLSEAVSKVCRENQPEAKIEIAAAVIIGNIIYLSVSGKGKAILLRKGKLGVLLEGNDDIASASGYLQEDDFFVLGSSGFFQNLATGVLKATLDSSSVDQAAENLAPIIHGKVESGTSAAIIFKINGLTEAENPPELKAETDGKAEVDELSYVSKTALGEPKKIPFIINKGKSLRTGIDRKIGLLFAFLQRRFERKTIFLKKDHSQNEAVATLGRKPERSKKTIFTVVLILLVLLTVSVIFGGQQRKRLTDKQGVLPLLQAAHQKKEEGEALAGLNPDKARKLLLEAQDLVRQINNKNYQDAEFTQFQTDLQKILIQVLREYQVEGNLFYDLILIKQYAKGDNWTIAGGKLIVLDQQQLAVYEIGINDQKSAILTSGKSLEGALKITTNLPKVYILTQNSIIESDKVTKKEKLVAELKNDPKANDFKSFLGNLYLLSAEGKIWQYSGRDEGFGPQQDWLKENSGSQLADSLSMAIDGSIWILKPDGQVLKFTRGKKEAFTISGLPDATDKKRFPISPTIIYTNQNSANLYILDPGANEILVVNKSGEYQAAYIYSLPAQETAKGLLVSEENKQIFLLGENKIYVIEMK